MSDNMFLGKRGETEIQRITYNQLYRQVRERLQYYHPDTCDPDAFCQNLCCEIEKLMGIYPNVPEARRSHE